METNSVDMKCLVGKATTCSWDSNGSVENPDQLGCTCRQAADFELFEGVGFKDNRSSAFEPRRLLSGTGKLFGSTHGPELLALFTRCLLDDADIGAS